jgi:hypothetical protein
MWRETDRHLRDIGISHRWAHAFVQPGRADHHHRVTCDDCGAWLPLGPATDTPETALEVRAAEIAAHGFRPDCGCCADTSLSTGEFYGWHCTQDRDDTGGVPEIERGYLARIIAEHETAQHGGG